MKTWSVKYCMFFVAGLKINCSDSYLSKGKFEFQICYFTQQLVCGKFAVEGNWKGKVLLSALIVVLQSGNMPHPTFTCVAKTFSV